MNYLNDIIYNMQAPSPKPQQVKAWALTSPLDNPSFSIRYNTSNLNTASVPTCWAWGGGSCQTWIKSRIKEGEWGKRKKVPFLKSGLKTRLGEDTCVFKWNTINLTRSGGFQYRTYQTVLHFHKAATWKNVYFETEAETYQHCWFIQELTRIQPPPVTNLNPGGSSTENYLLSFLQLSWVFPD